MKIIYSNRNFFFAFLNFSGFLFYWLLLLLIFFYSSVSFFPVIRIIFWVSLIGLSYWIWQKYFFLESYLEFDLSNQTIKLKSYDFWLQKNYREWKFEDIILFFGQLQDKQYHVYFRTSASEVIEIPHEIWQNYFRIKKIQESLTQAKIAQ